MFLPPLNLPEWAVHGLWWFVLLFQLLIGLILGGISYLYLSINQNGSFFSYLSDHILYSQATMFLHQASPIIGAAWATFACFFCYGALSMVWYSIKNRKLCFVSHPTTKATHKTAKGMLAHFRRSLRACVRVWEAFGVRGRFFVAGIPLREGIDITLQTIRAHSIAQTLSNGVVIQACGVIIFLNCVSTYVLSRTIKTNRTRFRLAYVVTDLVLDFVWGTILPGILFAPYIHLYMTDANPSLITVDIGDQEVAQLLVLSRWDFVFSVFPFVSALGNLRGIKLLLAATDHIEIRTVFRKGSSMASPTRTESRDSRLASLRAYQRLLPLIGWMELLHIVMALHGAIILIISIAASGIFTRNPDTPYDCIHILHPWLRFGEACVGRRINCSFVGIQGWASELGPAMQKFDPLTLIDLVMMDCPSLEMPQEIRQLAKLKTLTIMDSNISAWPMTAALTQENFPALRTLRIWRCSFEHPPEGIYRDALPVALEYVTISRVDISGFIYQVATQWENIKFIELNECHLDQVPFAVSTMRSLLQLSLSVNPISEIRAEYIESLTQMRLLWLYQTPLNELPDAVWNLVRYLTSPSLQFTNISSFPAWVNDASGEGLEINGLGTPLCDSNASTYAGGQLTALSCASLPWFVDNSTA